jgi:hypothetical protein
MERYAAELQCFLNENRLCGNLHCDTPRILLNLRRAGETMYIFAVNDNRTYDERTSIWKSMEEKGLPVKGTVVVDLPYRLPIFRELLSGKALKASRVEEGWRIRLELPGAGGAIIAVTEKGALPKPTVSCAMNKTHVQLHLENCGEALRPFRVDFNGRSMVRCSHANAADFIFPLAAGEAVPKDVAVQDMQTGQNL